MLESLKTGRLIHQASIVFCFAILIFVASPNPRSGYDVAKTPLDQLLSVNLDSFAEYAKAKIDGHIEANFVAPLNDALRKSGVFTATQFGRDVTGYVQRKTLDLPKDTTLLNLRRHFERDFRSPGAWIALPSPSDVAAMAQNVLKQEKHNCLAYIIFDSEPAYGGAQSDETLDGNIVTSAAETCSVPLSYSPVKIRVAVRAVPGVSLREWLASSGKPHDAILIETATPRATAFMPAAAAVWSEIADLTPATARSYVERKSKEAQTSISFLGLSVPGALVLWAAPLAVLAAMTFLLPHLAHLRRADDSEPLLKTFPWILLYRDRVSRVLAPLTLVVLPIGSILALLVVHYAPGAVAWWVGISIVAGLVPIAALNLRHGRELSKRSSA